MVGQSILHYQILEKLGAGGMGEIYKAQDTKLNRIVAIKVLTGVASGDPEFRRRFIQEAQAASSLNHPNIITIHDIISTGEDQLMVMEFVNGKTLGELIPQAGMGVAATLRYATQMADGLSAAHAAGVIHRDLKPGNVMVTTNELVKILDFGLAKLAVSLPDVSLDADTQAIIPTPMTIKGAIVGTLSYMSPEQAQGLKVDARSDIFSFGCVMYEMLTGRRAFVGESALMTLTSILRDEPRPVLEIAPSTPPELAALVHRALRKLPGERWQSMQEVHAELVRLKQQSDSGVMPAPPPPPPAPAPRSKPKPWGAVAVLSMIALAFAFGAVWWWMIHGSSKTGAAPHTNVAADNPNAPPKPSALSPAILTNQAIFDLAQAKVAPSVIIDHIRSSKTSFDLTTAEIIRLTKGGVTEAVIQAMRNPNGAAPANATPDAATAARNRTATVTGGEAFELTLVEDVTADCKPGQPLRFQAAKDVHAGDAVVIAKGAPAIGVVVEGAKKKFLVHSTRATFKLLQVDAVDGSKLNIRATAGRLGESRKDPSFEPLGGVKSKDSPGGAGSRFLAYFDGDQAVKLK